MTWCALAKRFDESGWTISSLREFIVSTDLEIFQTHTLTDFLVLEPAAALVGFELPHAYHHAQAAGESTTQ